MPRKPLICFGANNSSPTRFRPLARMNEHTEPVQFVSSSWAQARLTAALRAGLIVICDLLDLTGLNKPKKAGQVGNQNLDNPDD